MVFELLDGVVTGGVDPAGGGNLAEEIAASETGVPIAAFRVEDSQLSPPPRRAKTVASDHHLRPLPDHVPAQADPRSPGELQPEACRLGHRPVHRPGQAGRLEEDEKGACTASQGGQPMESVGRPGGARAAA